MTANVATGDDGTVRGTKTPSEYGLYNTVSMSVWIHILTAAVILTVRLRAARPSSLVRRARDEDVQEFYLGLHGEGGERKSFRDVKHYKRRKRWLS